MRKTILALLFIVATATVSGKDVFYGSKSNIVGVSGSAKTLLDLGYGGMIEENVVSVNLPRIMKNGRLDIPAMTARLNEMGVGKQVLNFLFQLDNGQLSEELLKQRALRNAERADVERAQMGLITPETILAEDYLPVLENNYLFFCFSYTKNNKKQRQAWILFHVDITKDTWEQVFAAWNNPQVYQQIKVAVSFVAFGEAKKLTDYKMLCQIAKKAPELAIRGQIVDTHPLYASISHVKKLDNAQRFYVYRQKQDSHGKNYSSKVSTVRTVKAHPRSVSSRNELYTIAGGFASKKKGDIAVWKPDSRWSIAPNYTFTESRQGGTLWFDYLTSMHSGGWGRHAIIELGGEILDGHRNTIYDINGTLYRSPVFFNYKIGFGLSYNFMHRIQVMPYFSCPGLSGQFVYWEKYNQTFSDRTKKAPNNFGVMYLPVGLRANINLFYPLQLTGGIEYNWHLVKKEHEELNDIILKPQGWKENELKCFMGLRYCF